MDYKEKYENALKRAKAVIEIAANKDEAIGFANTIFPELEVSKDERIRKAIVTFIDEMKGDFGAFDDIKLDDMLAWLEKQGEQKPVDKIESKFKVGDWIVDNDANVYQVKEINVYQVKEKDYTNIISRYELENIDGDKFSIPFTSDYNLRNWTIEDAKEQRDRLFQKMKEDGWEWDADKKELKKIEQELYPETLDKAIELYCYSYGNDKGGFDNLSLEKFKDIVKTFVDDYGIQKLAWSEEDEGMRLDTIKAFQLAYPYATEEENPRKRNIDWLKSLKPQPHWKPTDEQIHCFKCVIDFYKTKVNDTIVLNLLNSLYNELKKL